MDFRQEEELPNMISNQAEVTYTYNNGQDTVIAETDPARMAIEAETEMKLYKAACPQPLDPLDKLCYVLTVVNYKSTTVNQVVIQDMLPPGVTFNHDAMVTYEGGVPTTITPHTETPLTFTLPSLPAQEAAVLQFTADLTAVAAGTYLTNTATLTYDGYTGAAITAAITQHYSCAHIVATHEGPSNAVCGDTFHYTVYLHNTGDQPAEVTSFEDQLNACLAVNAADVTVAHHTGVPVVNIDADNRLTITGFAVPAGATAAISIPVTYRCGDV